MWHTIGRFVTAMCVGFLLTLLCLLLVLLRDPDLLAGFAGQRGVLQQVWSFATRNLQGSIPLFALVFLAYVSQMAGLGRLFRLPQPPMDMVMRREQLLDLCASLFFGIGVIWTAIGMRGALLFALGDTSQVTADSGMAVLQRLVEGGILLALSTTIVGGIGGYLMRAGKQLLFGRQLATLYLEASRPQAGSQPNSCYRAHSEQRGRDDGLLTEEPVR